MRRRLGNYVRRSGLAAARIGAELAFLPADSAAALRKALPDSAIKDALFVLERLRAVKRPDELQKLRLASEKVIDLMLAVIAKNGPGATKRELTEALRRAEIRWETIDRSSEKARCGSECISLLPSPWT
jgi:Xaa-Pro aminopeptidase